MAANSGLDAPSRPATLALLHDAWHSLTQRWGLRAAGVGLICLASLWFAGCGGSRPVPLGALRVNEVMSANDGASVDEVGQADDWIELRNDSEESIWLDDFMIRDKQGATFNLPHRELSPGERVVLWADDDESQGELHLPFKLSASGDEIFLNDVNGVVSDHLVIPPLADNDSYARIPETETEFVTCRYATPGRDNGLQCGPPPPPELVDNIVFDDFTWPEPFPASPSPLSINELALKPATFIELVNTTDASVSMADFALTIAPNKPGEPWPAINAGVRVSLGDAVLGAGEHLAVAIDDTLLAALIADPLFEGVVTVFRVSDGSVIDRVDFMSWPDNAVLARQPDAVGHHAFCASTTPNASNTSCDPLASRPLAKRDRHFYTPGDFMAFAAAGTDLGISGVKFVVDRPAGNVVHLLSTDAYDLHYTFVREEIDHEPHMDRCNLAQQRVFNAGWQEFAVAQYDETEGKRRYFLGALDRYASGGQHAVHFFPGDEIKAEHMREAFFAATSRTQDATQWMLHPQNAQQAVTAHAVNGQLPILGQNAPYRGQTYQPLTRAVGFGVLRFVPVAELHSAELGPEVIVVTDDVPNDIALVGGLITESFQTPLAHVNLLSRNRNTPNLALKDARTNPQLAPLFDKLVRLEVTSAGFDVREASAAEAQVFWDSRRPAGPRIAPAIDLTVRGVQPLSAHALASLPKIGAKAAQLAELARVRGIQVRNSRDITTNCGGPIPTPPNAFAIPLVHSVEHFEASGALQIFNEAQAELRDPTRRNDALERIRAAIMNHPVDSSLLAQVHAEVSTHFGTERVRLRSSSNTEDLPEFNGAGLYESISAAVDDPERTIADGMRTVWSSLWSRRAFDEREQVNIDQARVAMGILVHEAFPSERANGVGISRNILNPLYSFQHYFNFQIGEAAVTNPAPGVTTEQVVHWPEALWNSGAAELDYQSHSSLTAEPVMSLAEIRRASCVLRAIQGHFKLLIDPGNLNRWFAMDIELKLLGDQRTLMVKQARPYSFGSAEIPADCREF